MKFIHISESLLPIGGWNGIKAKKLARRPNYHHVLVHGIIITKMNDAVASMIHDPDMYRRHKMKFNMPYGSSCKTNDHYFKVFSQICLR